MTNKNNNLNDDVNMSKQRNRRRKHNNNKKDISNNTDNINDILDYIGAKNGITFLANGSSNGANKVSPDVFEDILKKLLASDSPNNSKKEETTSDIGSIPSQDYYYSLTHAKLNPFESSSTDDILDDDDDVEDYFEDGLDNIFDELLGDDMEDEENCPMSSLFKVMMQTKPFGIEWEKDKVVDFLKQNGYEIHQKKSKIDGSEFTLAYKAGVTKPIDEINITNLSKEFSRTIQDIILKLLLKFK